VNREWTSHERHSQSTNFRFAQTSSTFLDSNVFELHPHRFAGVKLKGQDAAEERLFWMIVGEIKDEAIVEIVLNVSSLADDHDIIPAIQIEELLVSSRINQLADHLLAVLVPRGLFANKARSTTPSTFVVDKPCDAGQNTLIANLVLVTSDDPGVSNLISGDMLGSILDPGVVRGVATKRKTQFEVLRQAILPNDKRVPLGGIVRRRFATDGTILDRPQTCITVPTAEVLSIKNTLHVVGLDRGCLGIIVGLGGDSEYGKGNDCQTAKHHVLQKANGMGVGRKWPSEGNGCRGDYYDRSNINLQPAKSEIATRCDLPGKDNLVESGRLPTIHAGECPAQW
jgi:hypothetical protein